MEIMEDTRTKSSHQNATINCKDEIVSSMSKYFNNPEMSDLTLKIGEKKYYAHKFVLGLMSEVFRTMCSQRWEVDGVSDELEIQECEECIPVFERFLKFLYCGTVTVDINTALPLLMLADKYNIQPLKQSFEQYMNKMVNEGSVTGALRWLSYAQLSGHSALQNACIGVVINKMDEVVVCDDFLHLELGFLLALLARDDLVVMWEQTIYAAVCRWIDNQVNFLEDQLKTILSLVRFPLMIPMQLHAIETSEFFTTHNHILSPMISVAHRFRSIAGEVNNDEFVGSNFRPRNYTHRLWCHFLTVDMNGEAFFQNSIGVRCLNHPVLSMPEQYWQVRVIGEKRTARVLTTGHKPTLLPNLGYSFTAGPGITERTIPLTMKVTPLRAIKHDVLVEVSLFQVKKDKLVKQLCQSSLKFAAVDNLPSMEGDENFGKFGTPMISGLPPQPTQQSTLKFSPTPMHFSVMFQQAPMPEKNEIILKYNFGTHELDHPAEVPCFKFNGPLRMTNSVRVAIIFKPRFVKDESGKLSDDFASTSILAEPRDNDSGVTNSTNLSDDSDCTILG